MTRDVQVGCVLDDGSFVQGILASFNTSADESPDRDLVLKVPLKYRPSGAREPMPYPVSAVSIAASHIVSLFVSYVEPTETTVPQGQGQAAVPVLQAGQPYSGPTAAAQI